jgi:glutamate---cysteine ligase / carboxylate-amine ligase
LLEHKFTGPSFTIGVEEELMILDPDGWGCAQAIDSLVEEMGPDYENRVKPELMKSVLEIATTPCESVAEAGAQLVELRNAVIDGAARLGLAIAASATHPFALALEQEIVDKPRYQDLVSELGVIARNELIFGTHVHVGIEGADRAVYIADGIRRYLPLLLALSTNSPFWQGQRTGLMSSRVPVFRAFPREGIPPHYGTWEIFSHRVELMMRAGAIPDYTFLWWDVRPHPNLGTVETRIFDQQTHVEQTLSLAALNLCLAHRLCAAYDAEEPLLEYPSELIDDNKIRAARWGIEGRLVDFRAGEQVPAPEMARGLLGRLAPHAEKLGCAAELDGIEDLLVNGTGAQRQLAIYERTDDLVGLAEEISRASRP